MTVPTGPVPGRSAAVIATFLAFGVIHGLFAGSVPAIARAAGIGKFELGIGFTVFTIAVVVAMSLGSRLARTISHRRLLLTLIPLVALAAAAMLTVRSYPLYFVVIGVYGLVIGLLDLIMNAEASAVEAAAGRPLMSRFHAAASFGMAVGAITGSMVADRYGTIGALPIIGLAALAALAVVHRHVPAAAPVAVAGTANTSSLSSAARGHLLYLGLAAGLVMAAEHASMLWSAKLLDEQAPAIAAFAGAGLALFGLANAVIRLFGDRLRSMFGDLRLAAGSIAIAAIGFAGVGLSTGFFASVVSFALTGIGVACVVPVIFSLAAAETPDNRAAGLGFIMLVAGAPRILAPWVFGWIADTYTFTGAFGAVAVLLVVAFGIVAAMAWSGATRAAKA